MKPGDHPAVIALRGVIRVSIVLDLLKKLLMNTTADVGDLGMSICSDQDIETATALLQKWNARHADEQRTEP